MWCRSQIKKRQKQSSKSSLLKFLLRLSQRLSMSLRPRTPLLTKMPMRILNQLKRCKRVTSQKMLKLLLSNPLSQLSSKSLPPILLLSSDQT